MIDHDIYRGVVKIFHNTEMEKQLPPEWIKSKLRKWGIQCLLKKHVEGRVSPPGDIFHGVPKKTGFTGHSKDFILSYKNSNISTVTAVDTLENIHSYSCGDTAVRVERLDKETGLWFSSQLGHMISWNTGQIMSICCSLVLLTVCQKYVWIGKGKINVHVSLAWGRIRSTAWKMKVGLSMFIPAGWKCTPVQPVSSSDVQSHFSMN